MTTKEINICGKNVTIAYCYATEIDFRKNAGVPMEQLDTTDAAHILHIIMAAMSPYYKSKGEDVPLTEDGIKYEASPEELVQAFTVIMQLRAEWYKMPAGEPTDEPTKAPKND